MSEIHVFLHAIGLPRFSVPLDLTPLIGEVVGHCLPFFDVRTQVRRPSLAEHDASGFRCGQGILRSLADAFRLVLGEC